MFTRRWRENVEPEYQRAGLSTLQDGTAWLLEAGGDGIERNGTWWQDHITCECSPRKGAGARWQPRIRAASNKALTSLGRWFTDQFRETRVKKLPDQPKIPEAQLVWMHMHLQTAVPEDLGNGSSMSHFCDRGFGGSDPWCCVRESHITWEASHQANMDRQRCSGNTLIIYRGRIVKVSVCRHSTGDGLSERLNTSCRRVFIIPLLDEEVRGVWRSHPDNVGAGGPDAMVG